MKKYIILRFILFTIVFAACKKIPFDKRNKYLGTYHFVYSYYTWDMSPYQSPTITDEYWGRVYYNKSEEKDKLHIEFTGSLDFIFKIDSNGNISTCGGSGRFADRNNVSFDYSSVTCPGNGQGGGTVYHVTGEKKKK